MKKIVSAALVLALASIAYNQCQSNSFQGLQSNYSCPDPSWLYGNPPGGVFQGAGVSGDMFYPAQAGIGTHVISYTTAPSAPVSGYTVTAGLPNNPANVPLTQVFLLDDDLSGPLPIGFNFNFFGTVYDQFVISSNGFITFDLNTWDSGCCSGQFIPDGYTPNNLIALAWNDLNPSNGGTIGYATIGTAPNRILIVEFNGVQHFGSPFNTVTVQAKLYESNGHIEIHCTQNSTDGSPHTIGVENGTGTCGITAPGMNADMNVSVVNEMILFTPTAGSYYAHQTGLPLDLYTGNMTPVALADDAISAPIPLGFTFDFYGNSYSQAFVSSNGFLTFSNNANAGCCAGGLLPSAGLPNNLIAFAWNNLNPSLGGTIAYTTIGLSPNRVFILEFNNIQHHGGGNPVHVQLKLFETSNLIEIHSLQNVSNGSPMTMGLENASGTEASTPIGRNANPQFSVINERTIFYPYYTSILTTEVISIEDTEPPVPFEPIMSPFFAECGVDYLPEPYAFDNCSWFIAGTTDVQFPITETTTVVWTFTDAAGNVTTVNQDVIIEDITAPVASGFVITITAQGFLADEVFWSFTDGNGNLVASGGPYWGVDPNSVLEVAIVEGTNGPYSFTGSTQGLYNDNIFSFSIQCQGTTVADGVVNGGQTLTINNIASCNPFTDIVTYCDLLSLDPVLATDNCAGTVQGTNDAVFPITSNTTITWTFDDGAGNITTQQQNIVIQTMNLTVSQIGGSLVANENASGVSYTWVDCNNNFQPIGVTNQAFTPTSNGSYAVIIKIGDCEKMSSCYEVTGLGVASEKITLFELFPNPANDVVQVKTTAGGKIELIDLNGKIIQVFEVSQGMNHLKLSDLSSGTYTLRMISANDVQTLRLVLSR
jgi:hypothetical protein